MGGKTYETARTARMCRALFQPQPPTSFYIGGIDAISIPKQNLTQSVHNDLAECVRMILPRHFAHFAFFPRHKVRSANPLNLSI